MSEQQESTWDEMVSLGHIARAQGRVGEVAVQPSSELEVFEDLKAVYLRCADGTVSPYEIQGLRFHKQRPVIRFADVSDITGAEALAGLEIRVPQDAIRDLPEDRFYHYQLIGLEVKDGRLGYLGRVVELVSTGGSDVLVIRSDTDPAEIMVPFCEEICLRVDPSTGTIETALPEGLLELNAH